ncbi:MAG: hypothetical protein NC913_04055 [Candidatus Omnitrophica bacterium]|nr:hypothetical protein [Candidatus Omnitrophota bacterium]
MLRFYKHLIATIFLSLPCFGLAEEILCTSDSVITEISETGSALKTIFEGNVKVISANVTIECEKAVLDHTLNQLTVDATIRLTQDKFYLSSDRLIYDFNSESGSFINGKFYFEPFYGKAKIVEKKQDQIFADTCILTTCDRENPHYHLYCLSIKLTEEKVSLKNLKIYLGKVPIFYFPTYSYNIKTKKPLFLFSGGYKTELGDGISLIFNNTGKNVEIQERIDLGLQGLGAGLVLQDSTTPDTTSSVKKFHAYLFKRYGGFEPSYGFIGEYQNEFARKQNLIIDWRWMRDNKFFRRHLYDQYLEKSKNPNYISYSRPVGKGIFNARIIDSAREEFLSPARIPEIEFFLPSMRTGNFLTSLDIISSRFIDKDGNEWLRFFSEAELEMPFNASFLKITPFLRFKDIYYSAEDENVNNFIFSPGLNMQLLAGRFTKKSKTYFSPSFSVYANYPSEKEPGFSFDLRDFNPDGIFSSLNLTWDFWHNGYQAGNITLLNLYDTTRTRFSDSILMWNFKPDRRWSLYGQERFNFSKGGMKEMTNCIVYNDKDVSFGFGHNYLVRYFDGVSGFLNKRKGIWEFGFSLNYDIKKEKFTTQRYYVRRQFHCLTAGIVYSRASTSYLGFFIMPSYLASK